MTLSVLIIGGLAVWRLTHAFVKENGPLMMFARLRAFLAAHQKRSGGLFDMISCTSCFSFWIALTASLFVSHDVFHWVGYALAFSGCSMLLESFFTKKSDPLKLIAPPATNNKVAVRAGATSEQRNNVVSHPYAAYGRVAIKT